MDEMIRDIHPVGQGAFYTEYFQYLDYQVAYDCGSFADGKTMPHTAPAGLKRNIDRALIHDKVDLLFVSHFHSDHINGIPYLLNKIKKPLKIILPRITPELQALYLVSMALKDDGAFSTFQSVRAVLGQFWRSDTNQENLVFVDEREEDGRGEVVDANSIRGSIKSGDVIQLHGEWMYVPVVFISKEIKGLAYTFKDALASNGISFINLLLNITTEDQWKTVVRVYKEVVQYNSSVENDVSLIVYSGPIHEAVVTREYDDEEMMPIQYMHYAYHYRRMRRIFTNDHHSGALYTGDMENPKAWNEIYSKLSKLSDDIHVSVLNTVGLLQISHHGSMNEFNRILAEKIHARSAFCCFGSENMYKHPSYLTLRHFLKNGFCVMPIDENRSGLREVVEVR